MCGRTCLTLKPEELAAACKYRKGEEKEIAVPKFRDEYNLGRQFSEFEAKNKLFQGSHANIFQFHRTTYALETSVRS